MTQPADPACLVGHQLAPAGDQQPNLGIDVGERVDCAQVAPVADLIGDHRGVARIALVFPAAGALAGPVDRQPGHMHHLDAGLGEHRGDQPGDPPDHIDAHPQVPVLLGEPLQLADQRVQRCRLVVDAPIQQHRAVIGLNGPGPVKALGDVDPDRDAHLPPLNSGMASTPLTPDFALQSDQSQCLISGLGEAAWRADQPPEPSTAASMKAILATPTTEGRAA